MFCLLQVCLVLEDVGVKSRFNFLNEQFLMYIKVIFIVIYSVLYIIFMIKCFFKVIFFLFFIILVEFIFIGWENVYMEKGIFFIKVFVYN